MAQTRSRTPLVIGIVAGIACLGLALLLVLALVTGGILFWNSAEEESGPGTPTAGGELVLPPGVAQDQPYLELSTSEEGPVVDVYIDFLCPHCATFHDAQGGDLQRMAQNGEITLRVHPRPMLDPNSTPEGYSGRAANAAVCAYAQEPAQWFSAESALFTNQPGTEGLSDEELSTLVGDATGLEVSECVTSGTYLPWIEDVVEPEALSSTQGTPAVLIDGEEFSGDPDAPGSVAEAVATA